MKRTRGRVLTVQRQPLCDFCDRPALFSGRTNLGVWANMCPRHFKENGLGLGLGVGQRLRFNGGAEMGEYLEKAEFYGRRLEQLFHDQPEKFFMVLGLILWQLREANFNWALEQILKEGDE